MNVVPEAREIGDTGRRTRPRGCLSLSRCRVDTPRRRRTAAAITAAAAAPEAAPAASSSSRY